ncbi:MAG: hypothetical protein J6B75_08590 [Ruminococcus sp.]|nr:hypothetical protein [Ruminococcus sp.]
MRKKLFALLGVASLVGVLSTSIFVSYADGDDKSVPETKNESVDYEAILSPYRNVFDDFNKSHGTTYGFMTDEQLTLHNIDKEEYLQDVVNEYSNMTAEEFWAVLEEAYSNDVGSQSDEGKISADIMPYYPNETQSGTKVTVHSQKPDPNGNNIFLLKD